MQYILNNKEFDSIDIENIINEIDHSNLKLNDTDTLNELIQIFDDTNNFKLIDTIALIFCDLNNDLILQSLVRKLDKIKDSNHTSTVIYACSQYDCSRYLMLFIDLLVNYGYHSMIESYSVLNAIKKPINLSDKILADKKLSESLLLFKKGDEEYTYITSAIDLVENMSVE